MNSHGHLHHPVVAVPAKDEEQRLPVLLRALARQTWQATTAMPLSVVVVLNNCADGTKAAALSTFHDLAELSLELIEVDFPSRHAHVGSARRLAMDHALTRCETAGNGVIITTDADAVPEPEWVEANIRAIENGADLVGGLLYGNREEEARFGPGFAARAVAVATYSSLCDRLASLIDPQPHDPWPRHQDHTGGSLAIKADTYRAVGGLPIQRFREDLALVSRVRSAGGRLVHPLDVRVGISARLVGRAPGGMADCLKAWLRAEAEGLPILVEDLEAVRTRLLRRRAIRDVCAGSAGDCAAGLVRLGVHEAGLAAAADTITAEALVERFAPDEPDARADMDADHAIAAMQRMIEDLKDLEGIVRAA